jgi:lipopolysaccharide/colanic/teichoic acid biosynthesis glycosyltransferase
MTALLKRALDILLSGSGLICSFPVWIAVYIAIKVDDGGPIFYLQKRVTEGGRTFNVVKFRSMVVDAEKETGAIWAKKDDPRVTRVGRFLRATAMDELPQLLNIFSGQMSFVGPRAERPELVEQFSRRIPKYNLRFTVKPGLTGLAQVYGRYDTSPERKLRYDLLYIKRMSFCLDLKLIFLSFVITFRGRWESRERKWRR